MRTSIDLQGYLINWRADLEKAAERKRVQGMEAHQEAESIEADIDDLDRAIAALTPSAPSDESRERIADFKDRYPGFQAEQETAPAPVEIEIPEEGLGSSLIAMGYGDNDTPAEHISILTGDPAIEPETGLHWERPALNADMQDEREEPVELPQPEWNEPQPTEGYAPVTSPAADEAAKAHDWYDPKAVADRERNAGLARLFAYNPFYKPKVDA